MKEVEIVAAVIIKDRTVLAVERSEDFMNGRIDLPAGHINKGEDKRVALTREVKEETGYDVEPEQEPFGEVSIDIEGTTYLTYLYTAEITGGTPSPQEGEVARILWVAPEVLLESALEHNLPEYAINPIIEKIIERIGEGGTPEQRS